MSGPALATGSLINVRVIIFSAKVLHPEFLSARKVRLTDPLAISSAEGVYSL